jgi:hypothetical protein
MVNTSLESVVEVCVCVLERLVLVVSDVGVVVAIAGLNRFEVPVSPRVGNRQRDTLWESGIVQ